MTSRYAGPLAETTKGPTLSPQESLLEVVKMLELAGHLVDRALYDDEGPAMSPEDTRRLVGVRAKIQRAVSLVMKQLTREGSADA